MNLQSVHEGDIVKGDKGGRTFFGVVEHVGQGEIKIEPITHNISYHWLKPREVIALFRRSKQSRA